MDASAEYTNTGEQQKSKMLPRRNFVEKPVILKFGPDTAPTNKLSPDKTRPL